MKNFISEIEAHYYRPDLYESILNGLKEMGVDLKNVRREHIAGVDEFHVRGAEVSKELAAAAKINNAKVLDVGCGLGGPCRMLAAEFDCRATGIDISHEFITTARKLSEIVGLSDATEFIQADATHLPFANKHFDVVWTQHVQMNISDKKMFYSEIERVLADQGTFLYYDIFKLGEGSISYPMPWASEPKMSFLTEVSEMESILSGRGFKKEWETDQTSNGILFFEDLLQKIADKGPPKLGLNLLMGESTITKITNLLNGLKEGKLMLQSGIYRKAR